VQVALLALAAVLATVGALGFEVACSRPIDLNQAGPTAPGGVVDTFLVVSRLSYGAHAFIGALLGAAGCDGGAVGLQWLKAGWHAETPEQEAAVAAGLRRAVALAGGSQQLEQVVCPYFPTEVRPSQDRAMRQAGLQCDVPVVEGD